MRKHLEGADQAKWLAEPSSPAIGIQRQVYMKDVRTDLLGELSARADLTCPETVLVSSRYERDAPADGRSAGYLLG